MNELGITLIHSKKTLMLCKRLTGVIGKKIIFYHDTFDSIAYYNEETGILGLSHKYLECEDRVIMATLRQYLRDFSKKG